MATSRIETVTLTLPCTIMQLLAVLPVHFCPVKLVVFFPILISIIIIIISNYYHHDFSPHDSCLVAISIDLSSVA